jgi:hypothetical protein
MIKTGHFTFLILSRLVNLSNGKSGTGTTTRKIEVKLLSTINPATGFLDAKSTAEPPPTERPKTIIC